MSARGHGWRRVAAPRRRTPVVVLVALASLLAVSIPVVAQSPGTDPSPSVAPASWTWASITGIDGTPLSDSWVPTDILAWDGGLAMLADTPAGRGVWLSDDGQTWHPAGPADLHASVFSGLTTAGRDLLVWSTDVADGRAPRTTVAVSSDGETWRAAPADGSTPFGTTAIEGMVRAADGTLAAWGVDRGPAGADRAVQRLFTGDGRRWRERPLEDRRGHRMELSALAPMGQRTVAFGRSRGWGEGSIAWLAMDPTASWWQGRAPRQIGAITASVATGSRAGAALVSAADGRRALWASRDAFDWWTVDGSTLPFTLGPETALTHARGTMVATGVETATGRRGLWLSDDGLAWVRHGIGDPASTEPGIRQVAVHGDTLVVALPGQVWSAPWMPVTGSVPTVLEPFVPLAAVEPGSAVRKPAGQPPVLITDRRPDARVERRGIVLELWVPQRTLGIGDWLSATLRVTNRSARTVFHDGTLDDLRCHPVAGILADTSALFDAGGTWTGHAARWKRDVIRMTTIVGLDTWPRRPRLGCADVGYVSRLEPGGSLTVPLAGWLTGPVGDQAVPAGAVPVTAVFSFNGMAHAAGEPIVLRATATVRTRGVPWRSITPGQLADAALRTPGFKAWLDERDPPSWGWQVEADLWRERTRSGRPGDATPDPAVVAQLGLYAESWTGRGWYWLISLDPWSGTFLGGRQP